MHETEGSDEANGRGSQADEFASPDDVDGMAIEGLREVIIS